MSYTVNGVGTFKLDPFLAPISQKEQKLWLDTGNKTTCGNGRLYKKRQRVILYFEGPTEEVTLYALRFQSLNSQWPVMYRVAHDWNNPYGM